MSDRAAQPPRTGARRCRTAAVLLIAAALGLSAGGPADAVDPGTTFRIATGTAGGVYFRVGATLAEVVSAPEGSRACEDGGSCGVPGLSAVAQTTAGSVENVRLIAEGQADAALVQADVAFWARTGTGPFEGEPPRPELTAVAALFPEALHIVVRADEPVHTLDDLMRRRVSVGPEGGATRLAAALVMGARGLALDRMELSYDSPLGAANALAAGNIDALFYMTGHPSELLSGLADVVSIRLLPIPKAERVALLGISDFFVQSVIPAGAYTGTRHTPTIGVGALFVVRSDLEEGFVHDISNALWRPESSKILEQGPRQLRDLSLGPALAGVSIPFHPGAARYYATGRRTGGASDAADGGAVPSPDE